MTTSQQDDSGEVSAAARRIAASLVEGLHLRFSLFALELGEERRRVLQMTFAGVALAMSVFLLLLCLNAMLLIVFWDTHRVPLIVGLCAFYLLMALALGGWLARLGARGQEAFSASRSVMETDRRALRERE